MGKLLQKAHAKLAQDLLEEEKEEKKRPGCERYRNFLKMKNKIYNNCLNYMN